MSGEHRASRRALAALQVALAVAVGSSPGDAAAAWTPATPTTPSTSTQAIEDASATPAGGASASGEGVGGETSPDAMAPEQVVLPDQVPERPVDLEGEAAAEAAAVSPVERARSDGADGEDRDVEVREQGAVSLPTPEGALTTAETETAAAAGAVDDGPAETRPTQDGVVFEATLGGVLSAASVGLVVVGAVQLQKGLAQQQACADANILDDPVCFTVDTPGSRFAAAGVSWGFAVPLAVGAGIWIGRAVRIKRASRAGTEPLTVTPSVHRRGGGLAVGGRF